MRSWPRRKVEREVTTTSGRVRLGGEQVADIALRCSVVAAPRAPSGDSRRPASVGTGAGIELLSSFALALLEALTDAGAQPQGLTIWGVFGEPALDNPLKLATADVWVGGRVSAIQEAEFQAVAKRTASAWSADTAQSKGSSIRLVGVTLEGADTDTEEMHRGPRWGLGRPLRWLLKTRLSRQNS